MMIMNFPSSDDEFLVLSFQDEEPDEIDEAIEIDYAEQDLDEEDETGAVGATFLEDEEEKEE